MTKFIRNSVAIGSACICLCLGFPSVGWSQPQVFPSQAPVQQLTTVVLADGDRISGFLSPSGAASLVLRTAKFGELRLPWSALSSVDFGDQVQLRLTDGTVVRGPVGWRAGTIILMGPGKESPILPQSLEVMQWVGQPDDTWREKWKATGAVNVSLSRGNSEFLVAEIAGDATYQAPSYGLGFYGGKTRNSVGIGGQSLTIGDESEAGVLLDHYVGSKAFVFGSGDFKLDRFQQVARFWASGGVGLDAIATKSAGLEVSVGLSRTRDVAHIQIPTTQLSSLELHRVYTQLVFSEESHQSIGKQDIQFSQSVAVYLQVGSASVGVAGTSSPNRQGIVPSSGQLRTEASTRLAVPMNSSLNWTLELTHSYTKHPYPGSQAADLTLMFGISVQAGNKNLESYSAK